MKVVKVYGALRELLGKTRFEFVADTPAQAMRALLVNFPQLEQWLIDSEKNGVAYRVTVGKQKIHNDDVSGLFSPWSEREVLSIAPVFSGAGGATRIIAGVALVALAVITYGGSLTVSGGALVAKSTLAAGSFAATGAAIAAASVYAGIYLIGSGVAQMLSPAPKPPGFGEAPTQLESNSFSGIVNTSRQGVPVPIAYGRVFVGSAVISAGLDVDQV